VLISDDYWSSYERGNVELVTEGIAEIRGEGIETVDGHLYEVDAIILATGFDVGLTSAPFPIHGLGDRSLDDAWKGGAVAYKGMTVSGFPNWFIMMGPNTGPGHTSVLVYTEAQIAYILQAVKKLIAESLCYVDVKQEVQDRYNAGIQKRMKHTAWTSGCNSWYLSEDGTNHSLFPGFASEYTWRVRRFRPSEYHLVPSRG
jgi:cation diffusion facilitator CzcD-associated flavoprotein CzcO